MEKRKSGKAFSVFRISAFGKINTHNMANMSGSMSRFNQLSDLKKRINTNGKDNAFL
jgi:hypothetical protein